MKIYFLIVTFCICSIAFSQRTQERNASNNRKHKAIPDKTKRHYKDYMWFTQANDTTYVDTTLTIDKEYKFNYLRRDNFERVAFSNMGQVYTNLSYVANKDLFPGLGARAKQFAFIDKKQVRYYKVGTPMTELFYKTGMEQGQVLDANIALNTSERLNFSIGYKGLRSLGKYQNIRTSSGNFIFSTNYSNPSKKYVLKAHVAMEDLKHQENGGILKLDDFESGNTEFSERARMSVLYQDAENNLERKRYFLDHSYVLSPEQNKKGVLSVGHNFSYQTDFYHFYKAAKDTVFAQAFTASKLHARRQLKTLENTLSLSYKHPDLGTLKALATHRFYNYFFNKIVLSENKVVIPSKFSDKQWVLGANWQLQKQKITLHASALQTVQADLDASMYKAKAIYTISDKTKAVVEASHVSRMPDFNFIAHQSPYVSYNWNLYNTLKNQQDQSISASVSTPWLSLAANYTAIDNYAYFKQTPVVGTSVLQALPVQSKDAVSFIKVKASNTFEFWKLGLKNTLMYQEVSSGASALRLPKIVTRNTLYYQDHVFDRAMFLQTGVTFSYFTKYFADAYNPLLSEFSVQNQQKIGGYPVLDFFINAKVRQTRIYLKAEHFNSSFTGFNFYTAPNYPYRDFIVRFGLVWNFFS